DEMTALSLCECLAASYAFGKAEAMPSEKPNAMSSPNPEAMPWPKGKDMKSQKAG
ncbi:hypothetical protein Tco_0125565, partial [Tanacetum coccineum]